MTSPEEGTPARPAPQRIGMVGLGRLGLPVAQNLLSDGHTVIGYRRHDMADFLSLGGTAANSSEDVARRCDLILLCLPNAAALHEVVSGPHGLCAGIRPGSVVADLGTFPIPEKERAREALSRCGVELLDAPVSGTPGMARARTAVVMASGSAPAIASARPGLDGVGITRAVGEFGNGSKLKCIANTLVAINNAAAAEAIALAEAVGLDIPMTIDVIGAGAGSSVMFTIRAPWMMRREFTPSKGSVAVLRKDMSVIKHLAADVAAPMPMLTAASALYDAAAEEGRSEHDIATLIEIIQASKGAQDA